jgi:hypothetical protein
LFRREGSGRRLRQRAGSWGGLFWSGRGLEGGAGIPTDLSEFASRVQHETDGLVGADVIVISFFEGGFEFADEGGDVFEFIGVGAEDAFLEGFEFEGAEGVDLRAAFLVPLDEGAFADVDFLSDAAEAEALGTEFDEFVFGFVGVHMFVVCLVFKP